MSIRPRAVYRVHWFAAVWLMVLAAAGPAAAQTYTWQNVGTDFTASGNWSSGGPPNATTNRGQFDTFGTFTGSVANPVVNAAVNSQLLFAETAAGGGYTLTGTGSVTGGVNAATGPSGLVTRGNATTTINLGNGSATSLALTGSASNTLSGGIDVGGGSTLILTGNTIANMASDSSLTLRGGTLVLDNSAGNPSGGNRLIVTHGSANSNLVFAGGGSTIEFRSAAAGSAFNLSLVTLKPDAGDGTVRLNQTSSSGALTVTFQTMGPNTSSITNFVTSGFGTLGGGTATDPKVIISSNSNYGITNGVIATGGSGTGDAGVGRALVNGSDFASYGANGVVAVSSTAVSGALSTAGTQNSNLTGSGTIAAGTTVAYNTLKIAPTAAGQSLTLGSGGTLATAAVLLTGTRDYTITGGTFGDVNTSSGLTDSTANFVRTVYVSNAGTTLKVDSNLVNTLGNDAGLTKGGDGILWLNGSSNQVNFTRTSTNPVLAFTVGGGVLRASSTSFDQTSSDAPILALRGGVMEFDVSGASTTYSRSLGGTTTPGRVNWSNNSTAVGSGGGGFSAYTGSGAGDSSKTLTVNIGGASAKLTWASTTNFLLDGSALKFGSTQSNGTVIFQNGLGLDGGTAGNYAIRQIDVTKGAGTSADKTQLAGAISGSSSTDLLKTGTGVLELTGTNTYAGNTLVTAGTLKLGSSGALPTAATANVALSGGSTLAVASNTSNGSATGGMLIVAGSDVLDFGSPGATTILRFGNSSTANWSAATLLTVTGWNGSTSGGGASRLFFGSDATGLTAGELSVIQFNIAGLNYTAAILSSGEVVSSGQLVPVPEPLTALGVAAAGLWLAGWARRRAAPHPGQ